MYGAVGESNAAANKLLSTTSSSRRGDDDIAIIDTRRRDRNFLNNDCNGSMFNIGLPLESTTMLLLGDDGDSCRFRSVVFEDCNCIVVVVVVEEEVLMRIAY